ncbi:hypothetical protein Poli38472_014206 [Pythium oligandrum]|uniref:Polycystin cation channel PKD1/PKD2 domain-containing protein n=1 Tax=Pythium oligandrum TaxID=41045 RepID=A0A8K1CIA9_PYTOL|nr:hypothetical protein Poli38472_014206 [Pythium oligandrum]|eukprot:TMW64089.1 hypothetical protein Poli38472_014206 [Pythium oligandrum]
MASEQKSKVAVLKTPQDEEITISYQDALGTLRHDRHMKRAILGIPFPVVYFCLFVAMLFQHVPTESLYQQAFSVSSVLDSTGTDASTTDTTMKYENIQTISDVFDWLTNTFVPNVFITTDYNNDTLTQDKWGRIAMFNKVLGAVNLETTTAKIHPCQAQPFLTTLYPQCYDAANVNTSNVLISFDTSAYEATDVIARLKARGDWLDFATQQLVITVVTYNGELQGYTVSKLQLDFHQGGYIELSSTITPTISDPYKKTAAITLDVLVGICFLATILDPAWHFVKAIRQDGRHFLRKIESWGLVDLCSTGFVAAFYGLWFSMVAMMYTKEFRENLARLVVSGKTFDANSDERLGLLAVTDALEEVANITIAMRLLAMLSVFALGAQILTQFRFHPRLNILTRTIANALHQFAAFFVVFIVIFMTFSVSGMVLFGDRVEDFSTLPRTFEACINMLFGNFDYSIIRNLQAPVGMLYYWAYMVVVCLVLLNMMLAIVLDSYAEVTEQSAKIKRSASFRRTLENIINTA